MGFLDKNKISMFFLAATSVFILGIIGCGEKNKNNNTVTPLAGVCGAGQIWSPQHSYCLQQCGQVNYGWDPNTNQCVLINGGTVNNQIGTFGNVWGARFIITSKETYRKFLEEYAGICNPQMLFGFSFGYANCNTWDSTAYIYMESVGTILPVYGAVTIYAMSNYSSYKVPVSITGTVEAANENTEFEIRRTGTGGISASYDGIIRVIGSTADLNQNRFRVKILYRGSEMGYADLAR